MSLKKIAEMTGVSVSTVSRVLNATSPTCASKETRDKIWEAARAIGYTPNEAARQLKKTGDTTGTSTAHRVTILLARVSSLAADPFFSELFQGLEVELMKQHTTIAHVVYAEESLPMNVSGRANALADGGSDASAASAAKRRNLGAEDPLRDADGVIVLGRCSHDLLGEIRAQNRNVVGIWRNSMDFAVDEVLCDGEAAARMAMNYLLSLGHRKIAYIGDCSYESRYVGYCNALIGNHIAMNYPLIKETNQTAAEAEHAFHELLEEKVSGRADFSAVFCANDATAIRVLEVLKKQKKSLRDAISVISIDDIEESQNTKPLLTTIHIPRDEMAHMAAALLLDRIGRLHREPVRIEFPCRLIERESCFAV